MDTLIFLYMVKGIKKKKIKKPKKTKRTNMYYAKFYPPKKKNMKDKMLIVGWRRAIFPTHTFLIFSPIFFPF